MTRTRLPNRRPAETRTVEIEDRKYFVTVGFAVEDGRATPREVFIRDRKEGSTLSRILDDASIAISLALQHGVAPATLARPVTRLPSAPLMPADLARPEGGEQQAPASIVGAALDWLVELDAEQAP